MRIGADVYNDGVNELQRHVYIKHTKFQNGKKCIKFALNNLKCMYARVKLK